MRLFKKKILNILITTYLFVIVFAGMPVMNTLMQKVKGPATELAFLLGIWPSWSMFAPNPIKFDSKTFVEIVYQDGSVKELDLEPKVEGPLSPLRKIRWMKYAQDNLRNPNQKGLLKPAILYFKQKYNSEKKPIVSISLKRKWNQIIPFNENKLTSISNKNRDVFSNILLTESFGD